MVGIVIVSHSAQLAAAVQELALQMVQDSVSLAVAAGIDDPDHPFGTDAIQIYQAIESVYTDKGVVVLMDLGSAVLSAEMAVEFLSPEQQAKVKLCAAPLVEGTIAAVVQAAAGATIEQVLTEANNSLIAKTTHLSAISHQPSAISHQPSKTNDQKQITKEVHLIISNPMGLHARPAAKLVATASKFNSNITLQNLTSNSTPINAKSINQVITLGIQQGHKIAITASGADPDQALSTLQQLINTNFNENPQHKLTNHPLHPLPNPLPHPLHPLPNPLPTLSGIPTSPGIAIGSATLYQPKLPELPEPLLDDPKRSWQELQTAIKTAQNQIKTLHQKVAKSEEAAIFDTHLLILQDPTLLEATHQQIFEHSLCAAAAWHTVIEETVNTYEKLKDPYLKARAVDVYDVGQRVLRLLTGIVAVLPDMKEPGILIATDLTPSSTVELNPNKILGICTVAGSAMSHAAILARSLGIPAVMSVGNELLHVENGTLIALDGETGKVWIEPDEAQLKELQIKGDSQLNNIQTTRDNPHETAKTKDGHSVKIMANIGGLSDVQIALENGADGVGLLRSEFLYLQRKNLPSEDELLEVYQAIAQSLYPHPLIIRLLDIGGDKPLPYLNLETETNPFLGWRGIRLLLDSPELLKTQLRAILRASYEYSIKIMFPMIASVREIRAAKAILMAIQNELREVGIPFNETIELGIMIEVPASVVIADQLATEVDFFSIGTNDLSQYSMAADRTNPKVAPLADALEPAVLRMIQQTIIAAHNAGIWVGVCGELASSSLATPILIGLGVDELSMNSLAIPAVKIAVSELSITEAEVIANHVLELDSAQSVRDYIADR